MTSIHLRSSNKNIPISTLLITTGPDATGDQKLTNHTLIFLFFRFLMKYFGKAEIYNFKLEVQIYAYGSVFIDMLNFTKIMGKFQNSCKIMCAVRQHAKNNSSVKLKTFKWRGIQ